MALRAGLDIVIVNWNAGEALRACLASIAAQRFAGLASVAVVDNASSDDSLRHVEAADDLPVHLLRNPENRGFAAACNQGAAVGRAPQVLFLNPDTELQPGCLAAASAELDRQQAHGIGILGVQLLAADGRVARSCARFPTLRHFVARALGLNRLPGLRHLDYAMADWDHSSSRRVDEVMGAFFLVRRPLFDALGGFDPRFYVYFEELDFALRAARMGAGTLYYTGARAVHLGGVSSAQVRGQRLFYSLRSRLLYGFKHFPVARAWLLLVLTLLLEPPARLAFFLLRGQWSEIRHSLVGYRHLLAALPAILRQAGR